MDKQQEASQQSLFACERAKKKKNEINAAVLTQLLNTTK